MITYKIISNSGQDGTDTLSPRHVSPKDKNFKEITFKRSYAGCVLKEGDWVKLRGTPKRGKITTIYKAFALVEWDHNRPMYIVVDFTDNTVLLCNPGQLKRNSKK